MTRKNTEINQLNQAGQNLTRILIASYFIAVSVGMVNGTRPDILLGQFTDGITATWISSILMFTLAYLVLMGFWLRPAALLLAMIVFWSAYLINFGPTGQLVIENFWRDLALIAALILTYTQTDRRTARRRAMLRLKPRVRKLRQDLKATPRRIMPAKRPANVHRLRTPNRPPAPIQKPATAVIPPPRKNIFADEPDDHDQAASA